MNDFVTQNLIGKFQGENILVTANLKSYMSKVLFIKSTRNSFSFLAVFIILMGMSKKNYTKNIKELRVFFEAVACCMTVKKAPFLIYYQHLIKPRPTFPRMCFYHNYSELVIEGSSEEFSVINVIEAM